jgi:hypothetical protein
MLRMARIGIREIGVASPYFPIFVCLVAPCWVAVCDDVGPVRPASRAVDRCSGVLFVLWGAVVVRRFRNNVALTWPKDSIEGCVIGCPE